MSAVLNKEQIAARGIKGGWTSGLAGFVCYGDLDTLNHVNNKVYHAWFENIRVLYIRSLGIDFAEKAALKTVVRTANIVFNAPMFQDEDYITLCRVSRLGRTSFTLDYAVWCDGNFRVTGDTVMVMVDADGSAPVPENLRAVMIDHDGAITA